MKVPIDPGLLLLESLLSLLEVVADRVGSHERFRLGLVVGSGGLEEGGFEVLLVDVEVLTVGVGDVESEGD